MGSHSMAALTHTRIAYLLSASWIIALAQVIYNGFMMSVDLAAMEEISLTGNTTAYTIIITSFLSDVFGIVAAILLMVGNLRMTAGRKGKEGYLHIWSLLTCLHPIMFLFHLSGHILTWDLEGALRTISSLGIPFLISLFCISLVDTLYREKHQYSLYVQMEEEEEEDKEEEEKREKKLLDTPGSGYDTI